MSQEREQDMFEKKNSSRVEYFALGFVAGMAVGAAVALLSAPKSGRLLRRDLRRGLEDASENVREQVETKMRGIQDNLKEVETMIRDAANRVTNR